MRINLSIVRFEFNVPEARQALQKFAEHRLKALEMIVTEARSSVAGALNQLMHAEMAVFLGQPDQQDNKRNGYHDREYVLKGIGTIRVRVPEDRKGRFKSAIIPKGERIDPRLSQDMAALHLGGISTRTLAMMSKRILGVNVSHQTVSSSLPLISEEAVKWLKRRLSRKYWCLIVDGTYFHVRRLGNVEKEPSLVVLGIDENNRRSILAVEHGNRDSADNWRVVFRDLKARGLDGTQVKIGVMDGLPGLEAAFLEEFPQAVTARCWFHALQNALAKVPNRYHDAFHGMLKSVMYAEGHMQAKSAFEALKTAMNHECARAVACIEKDLESLISHFKFPKPLWKSLKTTNAVERIHKEFKRRARAMEAMGEQTLTTLVAFTALRLEMAWQWRAIDTYGERRKKVQANVYEIDAIDENEDQLLLN